MNNIQNLDISLSEIVKNIDLGNYVIPKFQRDFVWKKSDIENLGDSLVRGYPISSMLVMPVNGTLKITYSSLKTESSKKDGPNAQYILDGQQRITSLAKIFLNEDERIEYYFDLLSMLVETFPEDGILNDPGFANKVGKSNSGYSHTSEMFCRGFSIKSSNNESITRQNNRFISGKLIIEGKYNSVINKFLKNFKNINENQSEKYIDYLGDIFGGISRYGIPITTISADADLNLVVKVFEKVNTTGQKLSSFDLINAKSFETQNEEFSIGLADYLKKSLNILIEQDRDISKDALKIFFEGNLSTDNNSFSSFSNLARITRIIMGADLLSKNQVPLITNKSLLSKNADFWFEQWNIQKNTIIKFTQWIDKENLLSIGNKTFLESICSIIVSSKDLLHEPIFLKEVKKYLLSLSISGQPFNKSNYEIVNKFNEFGKHVLSSNGFEKYNFDFENIKIQIEMNEDSILNVKYGTGSKFSAIMYILNNEHFNGLFNVDLLDNPITNTTLNSMDYHHIIPKSTANKLDQNIVDSIANITLLNKNSNRYEIKDTPLSDYMESIKNIHTETKFKYILDQNLIDIGLISAKCEEDYYEFIINRSKLITKIINSYFKNNN